MFLFVLIEGERERERPERETRFMRKLYKFTFIIYEGKNIFSSNLICLVDHKETL